MRRVRVANVWYTRADENFTSHNSNLSHISWTGTMKKERSRVNFTKDSSVFHMSLLLMCYLHLPTSSHVKWFSLWERSELGVQGSPQRKRSFTFNIYTYQGRPRNRKHLYIYRYIYRYIDISRVVSFTNPFASGGETSFYPDLEENDQMNLAKSNLSIKDKIEQLHINCRKNQFIFVSLKLVDMLTNYLMVAICTALDKRQREERCCRRDGKRNEKRSKCSICSQTGVNNWSKI